MRTTGAYRATITRNFPACVPVLCFIYTNFPLLEFYISFTRKKNRPEKGTDNHIATCSNTREEEHGDGCFVSVRVL